MELTLILMELISDSKDSNEEWNLVDLSCHTQVIDGEES